jgi:type IV pilus assembly protein PilB
MAAVRIGEILIRKGLISKDTLNSALSIQAKGDPDAGIKPGEKIGKILIKKKWLEPMTLVRTLCEQNNNVDFIYAGIYLVEPRIVGMIPEDVANRYHVLPLVSLGENTILVATRVALKPEDIAEIEKKTGFSIQLLEIEDDPDMDGSIAHCYATFRERGLSEVRVGEMLVRDGYVSQADMDEALRTSIKTQRMVGKVLIEMGKINEADFFKILSQQRKLPLIAWQDLMPTLDKSLARTISKSFCIHNYTVPCLRDGDTIHVVTAEPAIDTAELMKALRCKRVKMSLATYSDISRIVGRIFANEEETTKPDGKRHDDETLEDIPIAESASQVTAENIDRLTKKYSKLANSLLMQAIKKRASDIHIEVYDNSVVVRYRIDGTLYDNKDIRIGKDEINGVNNVIKINSSLNIAERRLPQGGRFRRMTADKQVYDFRVQTQPGLYGENTVIRILKQTSSLLSIDELGLMSEIGAKYLQLIQNPSGLILITGPTGSGKTTTLYSTLGFLSDDLRKKIITIEDPVEYSMGRIQQVPVREEIGFGFAQAVRSFLRQDPDVMLIGEIRDHDTAVEALRASQTGHLVFSTLHVNNTIETVQRLLDLDVVTGSIAAELLAVISQRLAKRNCQHCKSRVRPEKSLLDMFYPRGVDPSLRFYKGEGCEKCDFTGHTGRVAIFEFWFVDTDCKRLILEGAGFSEIYDAAVARGLMPMIKDALAKVEQGIIPLDELPNVIPHHQIARWTGA